ncbi:SDR family NAD(P)-dependent oxidoreductase [Gordonia sp. NPDC058843]|uniref:SDR family NAD(P)-dependent oxidoreductase n=1 Tax=Gordonia sp. NPDC058843 TaxID=3346648 RepID=UPI0036B82E80
MNSDSPVAVVTGAAGGIGAATAARLHRDGFRVVLTDLSATVHDVAAGLDSEGNTAVGVTFDVTDEAEWTQLASMVTDRMGPVSALISNAVAVDLAPLHRTSTDSWHRQLEITLTGTFLGVRTFIDDLRSVGNGSIVLVSSVHAWFGLPERPAYATAKAGLAGLGRQLAVEYGGEVRVNTVLPGPILTALWDDVSEQDRRTSASATAAGRLGQPDEVASAISFLVSRDASYITGVSLPVDGGWTISKDSS